MPSFMRRARRIKWRDLVDSDSNDLACAHGDDIASSHQHGSGTVGPVEGIVAPLTFVDIRTTGNTQLAGSDGAGGIYSSSTGQQPLVAPGDEYCTPPALH